MLDEIGRGTSTYDGLALAWAVVEHIHRNIRAKTLFATHYHELTELAGQLDGVRNLHVSVKESGDQILFLRRVEPGAADRSYGIEVARLAALPMSVIERAREILTHHESERVTEELAPPSAPMQIQLFEPVNHQLADRIRDIESRRASAHRSPAASGRTSEGIELDAPLFYESCRHHERHFARRHRRRHRRHSRQEDRAGRLPLHSLSQERFARRFSASPTR